MGLTIHRSVFNVGPGGIAAKVVVVVPVSARPDRAFFKAPSAVRADIVQHRRHTVGAKRALVGANARLRCLGWQ